MHRERNAGRGPSFQGYQPLPSSCLHDPRGSPSPVILGLPQPSLHRRIESIKSITNDWFSLQTPALPLEVQGWDWKFQPSKHIFGTFGSQPLPLSYLINRTGNTSVTFNSTEIQGPGEPGARNCGWRPSRSDHLNDHIYISCKSQHCRYTLGPQV